MVVKIQKFGRLSKASFLIELRFGRVEVERHGKEIMEAWGDFRGTGRLASLATCGFEEHASIYI